MKHLFLLLAAVFLPLTALSAAEMAASRTLDSNIREVKVFSDRALVTRTASVKFAKGEQTLVFDSLPPILDKNSVQVTGMGRAILKDIKIEDVTSGTVQDDVLRALTDKRKMLEDSIAEKQDLVNQSIKEKDYLQDISRKTTSPGNQDSNSVLDVQKWTLMMDYYRSNFNRIDKDLRQNRKTLSDLKEELDAVNRKISALGYNNTKTVTRVSIIVDAAEDSPSSLSLTYMIPGPSWTPLYDMRFSSKDKNMEIRYHARIRQSTGEDWSDALLTLSTARPEIGGTPPELSPWYVDIYSEPPVSYNQRRMDKASGGMMNQMAMPTAVQMKKEAEEGNVRDEAITVEEAAVSSGLSSVVFTIAGRHTIQSDNQEHMVTIAVKDFPVTTRYSTVPRLSPYAFLKVNLTNNSDYSFLPGDSHIFMDGNFIANSEMAFVTPGEGFWTFLGVDENIKIDYKQINKETRKDGLVGDKEVITYNYLITVKNNKQTAEELVLWDQLPISKNKEISVEILEPKFTTNTDGLKKNEYDYLEWLTTLKPGEERKIPFSFLIRYPAKNTLSGAR